MMEEVKKVQALLDLPSDNEDKFVGYDDLVTLPTNESIKRDQSSQLN